MTFDEWYASREWWKDQSDIFEQAWETMESRGIAGEEIAEILDSIISAVSAEYGD